MLKVAVVGASGYTGGELIRLVTQHPKIKLIAATSEQSQGKTVETVFPNLQGRLSMTLQPLDLDRLVDQADLFFLALPHTKAMTAVPRLLKKKKAVIDLSADFRFKDPLIYEKWYQTQHAHPELCPQACYGLPELYREAIRKARLVAVPGCYPTGAILGLLPLMMKSLIDPKGIIIDAKSGVSGAGRTTSQTTHFPEVHGAISAYNVGHHRHIPEIEQALSSLAKKNVAVTFTPHLVPINRGILTTIYVRLVRTIEPHEVMKLFQDHYKAEPFIHVLPPGNLPNTGNVQGSNDCHIGLVADTHASRRSRTMIIVTAIDNLVKGAAGQAIQNMNLMMGYDETLGLASPGLFP